MALEVKIKAFSTDFPKAYVQIVQAVYKSPSINPKDPNTILSCVIWANKTSREAEDDSPISSFQEQFNLDISKANQNPIKKGYEHLKTLESMANAKDV